MGMILDAVEGNWSPKDVFDHLSVVNVKFGLKLTLIDDGPRAKGQILN